MSRKLCLTPSEDREKDSLGMLVGVCVCVCDKWLVIFYA